MSVKQTMEIVTRFALTHLAAIAAHVEKASVLSLQMQALVKVCKNDSWLIFTLFFFQTLMSVWRQIMAAVRCAQTLLDCSTATVSVAFSV